MTKPVQKITLSQSRDIAFNRLVLSQSNVRRIKAGISIEELAEDIARRTLLQSLTVRPVLDEKGAETGMFEIPAGGRRYRALERLVQQKRLARTAPIPCIVRTAGLAEEDSLAENVQRAPLHPLDQFRAFLVLRETGKSEEEIAAAFFVSVAVVKQRLKLAAVSPKLLALYGEDAMTLDQLMGFTVNPDHARQEQVWQALQRSHSKEAYHIRRLLTDNAVQAGDKRAQFLGIEAYEAAGGAVLRDLFEQDDGGWLQDTGLLDRLVAEKLEREAEAIRSEGWKWVEAATDFPYGHTCGMGRIAGQPVLFSGEEYAAQEALRAEYDELEARYAAADDLPDAADERLGEIETALAAFEERPLAYAPQEIARAGAFVSIDSSGVLRVERGYIRPEDDPAIVEAEPEAPTGDGDQAVAAEGPGGPNRADVPEEIENDGVKPLGDRLLAELAAHRTIALRQALGEHPEVAFLAVLHALCLKLFYCYAPDSCLAIEVKTMGFASQAIGLNDTAAAKAVDERHRGWCERLPEDATKLWDALLGLETDSRQALLAHCAGLTLHAVHEASNRRPRAHADRLAKAVGLDMAAAGWTATVDSYLGRVTKAQILQAVCEAKGEGAGQRIAHLKKADMAETAQALLAGTGWLPEPLRTPARSQAVGSASGTEPCGLSDGLDMPAAEPDAVVLQSLEATEESGRAAPSLAGE